MEQPTLFDDPKKECKTCHKELPATTKYFSTSFGGRYGLRADCKQCIRARNRTRNKKNRQRGFCKCGVVALSGKSLCGPCFDSNRALCQRFKQERRDNGQCVYCCRPTNGRSRCVECAAKDRQQQKRAARKRAGLCVGCGKSAPEEGRTTCAGCRERMRADGALVRAKRKAGGLCQCGKNSPLSGFAQCGPCRAAESKRRGEYVEQRIAAKRKVHEGYGCQCACCGERNPLFLTVDHVDGGGNTERRTTKGNQLQFYDRIIRDGFPSRFQLLCMQCNWAKGQYGRCPHQGEPLYMPHELVARGRQPFN